jgi:four helix bundle protein
MENEQQQPSPFDLQRWLQETTWQRITETEEYRLTTELLASIDQAFPWFCERPKYASLLDQLSRNSASIRLNFCEALGKARGHVLSSLLIARGECMECLATVTILPERFRSQWTPLLLKILEALDKRISRLPTK